MVKWSNSLTVLFGQHREENLKSAHRGSFATCNRWEMNDDVLACIGQYADADARRAMGSPPNRLDPADDNRYVRLRGILAQRRVKLTRRFGKWITIKGPSMYSTSTGNLTVNTVGSSATGIKLSIAIIVGVVMIHHNVIHGRLGSGSLRNSRTHMVKVFWCFLGGCSENLKSTHSSFAAHSRLHCNQWKMNDDTLACIGEFADADARRAMGLPPNRLNSSDDNRYDRLRKLFAQRQVRGLSDDWMTVLVYNERFYHSATIYKHKGVEYVFHQYRQPDSEHCWEFSYKDQIVCCRLCWCETTQCLVWRGGQWVAVR
jgi:hypothetical protein